MVARLSRLSSSDAVEPAVAFKPNIKSNGAATPPKKTMAAIHGASKRVNCASFGASPAVVRAQCHTAKPVPEPR
jgi:hypothetical protein